MNNIDLPSPITHHRSISIKGSEVIPVALFNPLNGKFSEDYVARVEPSSQGGEKMAEYLLDMIDHGSSSSSSQAPGVPVESTYMAERD